jgi:hypothetical protein
MFANLYVYEPLFIKDLTDLTFREVHRCPSLK